MESLKRGNLSIDARISSGSIVLEWTGRSAERAPSKFLAPFFETVMDVAVAQSLPIEMRFERLDHFNSSTITALIQMLQEATDRSVRVALVFDEKVEWQRISFDALSVFCTGDGLVELRAA